MRTNALAASMRRPLPRRDCPERLVMRAESCHEFTRSPNPPAASTSSGRTRALMPTATAVPTMASRVRARATRRTTSGIANVGFDQTTTTPTTPTRKETGRLGPAASARGLLAVATGPEREHERDHDHEGRLAGTEIELPRVAQEDQRAESEHRRGVSRAPISRRTSAANPRTSARFQAKQPPAASGNENSSSGECSTRWIGV